ncbi:hypothetical protein PHYPSEUDO_001618 [Phytophthora pseudosyringae]|uniref:Uncharacterized protein n=1 Tax=Phytophthora pseudosyringae TaxID=221518 RepID=A0A8T1VWL3_9STRA|nr:hypothetical protein PHYPSEUDO_001618 [Phytophthora pseudosyringae]
MSTPIVGRVPHEALDIDRYSWPSAVNEVAAEVTYKISRRFVACGLAAAQLAADMAPSGAALALRGWHSSLAIAALAFLTMTGWHSGTWLRAHSWPPSSVC